jgi:hypothetical protein
MQAAFWSRTSPQPWVEKRGVKTLEDAFIAYLDQRIDLPQYRADPA